MGGAVLVEVVDLVQKSVHNCPGRGGLPDSRQIGEVTLIELILLIPNQLVE